MIQIYNGTMTSRERVLRTFNHEKADRVPIDFFANPEILRRTAAALGVPADRDSVNDALGASCPLTLANPCFRTRRLAAVYIR